MSHLGRQPSIPLPPISKHRINITWSSYSGRAKLDKGINWIDTAAVYGLRHSEEVLRRVFVSIPRPDPDTAMEDCWGEMIRLIEERKVRAGGALNFDVSLLERCEKLRHVDCFQSPFSIIPKRLGLLSPSTH